MTRAFGMAAFATGLLAGSVAFAQDGAVDRGRVLAQTCIGCHGVESYNNVYPTYKVPKLVGQHEAYLVAALKAYRSGERSHPTMQSHAATMTDQDMQDIAAYIASTGMAGGSDK